MVKRCDVVYPLNSLANQENTNEFFYPLVPMAVPQSAFVIIPQSSEDGSYFAVVLELHLHNTVTRLLLLAQVTFMTS